MTPEQALRRAGPVMGGARILRSIHVAPAKRSYLVEQGGSRYVLRVDGPGTAMPADAATRSFVGLDRAAEFRLMKLAWHAGLAPEPVAFVPGKRAILVTRYAAGNAWRAADLRDSRRLKRLAELLRQLHAIQVQAPVLDLDRAMAQYASRAGSAAARALAVRGRRVLARSGMGQARQALCHNDLVAANIVGWRRTLLIDWEYAASGDPLFDLAVVIRHHALPARQAEVFARAYFGGAGQVPREALRRAGEVYDHVLRLWSLAMAAGPGGRNM